MAIQEGLFQRIRAIQQAFTFDWPNHSAFLGTAEIIQIGWDGGYLYGFYEGSSSVGALRFALNSGSADTGSTQEFGTVQLTAGQGFGVFQGDLLNCYVDDPGTGNNRIHIDRHDSFDNASLSTIVLPNPDGASGNNNHIVIAAVDYAGDLIALWQPESAGASDYYVVTYSGFSSIEVSKFTISESNFAPDDMIVDTDNGDLVTFENESGTNTFVVRVHDGISATVARSFDAEGESSGAYDAQFSRLVTEANRTGYVHNGITQYDGPAP